MLQQSVSIVGAALEIAKDVLDQNHRRIDDDAEIDGADRQQVGILAARHHDYDGEEQGERNVDANNDGRAQVAQENPLDQEDQQAAEHQVVQDGTRRQVHQRAAVVVEHHLDAGWQRAVGVDFLNLCFDLGQHFVGVLGAAHHDDRGRDVRIVVTSGDAQPRHKTDLDLGHVLNQDRHPVRLAEHDVFDIGYSTALCQIVIAPGIDQADAADVDRLLTHRDLTTADVDVGIAERGDDLRDGDVVGFELVEIDIDVELLGGAAPAIDRHDAGNGQQPARHDPVLHRAEVGQTEVGRPDDLVADDLADQARLLDLRHLVARQVHALLQVHGRLAVGGVEIYAVPERDADEAQPVEGRRADVDHPGRRVERDLDRDRVVLLHLFGR